MTHSHVLIDKSVWVNEVIQNISKLNKLLKNYKKHFLLHYEVHKLFAEKVKKRNEIAPQNAILKRACSMKMNKFFKIKR